MQELLIVCESFEKRCREYLSVSFSLKACWRDGKDGWGGQVEVNKVMAGMAGEEMRMALCEDDIASSLGVKEGGEYSNRREKNR